VYTLYYAYSYREGEGGRVEPERREEGQHKRVQTKYSSHDTQTQTQSL